MEAYHRLKAAAEGDDAIARGATLQMSEGAAASGSGGVALDFAAAEQLSLAVGERIGRLAEAPKAMPLDIAAALASTFASTDMQHVGGGTAEVHELAKVVLHQAEAQMRERKHQLEEREAPAAIGQFNAFAAAGTLAAPLAPLPALAPLAALPPLGAGGFGGFEMKAEEAGAYAEREQITQMKEAATEPQGRGGNRGSVAMAEVAVERERQGERRCSAVEANAAAAAAAMVAAADAPGGALARARAAPKLGARRAAPSVPPPSKMGPRGAALRERSTRQQQTAAARLEKQPSAADVAAVKEAVALLEKQPSLMRHSSNLTKVEVFNAAEASTRGSRSVRGSMLRLTSFGGSSLSNVGGRSSLESTSGKEKRGSLMKMLSVEGIGSSLGGASKGEASSGRSSGGPLGRASSGSWGAAARSRSPTTPPLWSASAKPRRGRRRARRRARRRTK